MYVLNEFLTVDHSCTTKHFWKNFNRSLFFTSLRFFWHLLCPNWSIIRDTAPLWNLFGNRQFTVIEGKGPRFRNPSEYLEYHCAANDWQIWTQNMPKEAQRCELQNSVRVYSKIFCCTWAVGCQEFVQYIYMLWSGRFILIAAVSPRLIRFLSASIALLAFTVVVVVF